MHEKKANATSKDEQLLEKFIQTGECTLCGSQRCDATLEWAQGCEKYQEFIKAHQQEESKAISV